MGQPGAVKPQTIAAELRRGVGLRRMPATNRSSSSRTLDRNQRWILVQTGISRIVRFPMFYRLRIAKKSADFRLTKLAFLPWRDRRCSK